MGNAFAAARGKIAVSLMKRAVPGMVAADSIAELDDGLHVIICGSGSPLPDPKRGNPCTVIVAGGRVWVVDAGEGASERMARYQIAPNRIEGVLMTHFHSDHIGGLAGVALQRWVAEPATTPLRVIGPSGVERVVNGINEAYALDCGYRTAHHGPSVAPPEGAGMTSETFAIPDGEEQFVVFEQDGLKVTAFTVEHPPVEPAVGFRFDYLGRSVVISGDTAYSPVLVRASRDTDLLVHDALSPELVKLVEDASVKAGRPTRRAVFADIPDYHASPAQAADSAREAGAKALALTHIVPPLPMKALEAPFLADSRERFDGPLWIASDGDLYSLPPTGGLERSTLVKRGPGR
ncbi:MAG: MBL fold metallo-hydrolase [Actinomycetes bacterium]